MTADGSERREAGACPFFPSLAAYVVLLSAIQVGVVGASLVSLRLTRLVMAGIFVVSSLAAWLVWRALTTGEVASPWAVASNDRWGRRVAGAYALLYAFLLLCAAMAGDPSWDGNTYHLPAIQDAFQRGQIAWVDGPDSWTLFMNGYPKAGEVLSLFFCILLHPALSNAFNLIYLPLGALGIASIAHALGASRGPALLAGAALLLVPINLGQSLTTYVDSAFGSAVIAWLAVTVQLRRLDPQRSGLQAFVLGCALGQVIGVKGTGLQLGALGSFALIATDLVGRPATLRARALFVWWLGVAIVALAVGGYWYARNIAHTGNPLYPIGMTVAGITVFPGLDPYDLLGTFAIDGIIAPWPPPAQVAFTWLQGIWNWPRTIVGFDMRLGGLGFLWPLGCVPAIVALVRWRLGTRTTWREELASQPLWLLLAIVSIGFVLTPYRWWARHTIWIYALGLPCLAVVLAWPMGRWGRAWLVACAGVALVEAGIVIARWQVPLLGVAMRSEFGGPRVRVPTHFYPPWTLRGTAIERIAQSHDTVGIGSLEWYQQPIFGVVSEPVGARQVYFIPKDLDADFAAWYERVRPRFVIMTKRDLPESITRLHPEVYYKRKLMVLQFW